MQMPYEVFLALRYLRAKRKQAFLSIITWISVAGIAIGVMALILVLGVMTGFTDDLRTKILGTNSHIVITRHGAQIDNHRELLPLVNRVPGVRASTPFIISQVMLACGSNVSGPYLRGIDTATASDVINLSDTLVEGTTALLDGTHSGPAGTDLPGIILGSELAATVGAFPGTTVTLISPTGLLSPAGMMPRWKKFLVVGLFESGMYEYDTSMVYTSISAAQDFLKRPGEVSGIEIAVTDIYATRPIVAALQQSLGVGYAIRDWKEMHRNLYAALRLEKTAMFVILTLIILVAAFSIVSTLVMMVNDKNREIAILKSMGATRSAIMRIFMVQGLLIGITGTLVGLAAGCGLAWLQNEYNLIKLAGDVYYISALTVKINFWDTFWVACAAVVISFGATLYPALQAAGLDPVEAMRYE